MIAWWWLIPAFGAGALVVIVYIATPWPPGKL